MALLKTVKSKRLGSANYELSHKGTAVVISPNEDLIFIKDEAYDYDTLLPQFDKKLSGGLDVFAGHKDIPTSTALLYNRPTVFCSQNTRWDESPGSNQGVAYFASNSNFSYDRNLDKTDRMNSGSLFKFSDSGSNVHYIITHNQESGANGYSTLTLVQGSDITNPTNYVIKTDINDKQGDAVASTNHAYLYIPIGVDTTNKFIYLASSCFRTSYVYHTQSTDIFKVAYTTVPVDGSITLGTPTHVDLNVFEGNGRYLDSQPSFLVSISSGVAYFLTIVENEADYWGTSGGSSKLPSTAVKSNKGRYRFTSYNPATQTATSLADLKGSEGFVGNTDNSTEAVSDHLSLQAPSHFEPSPISGESAFKYAYSAGFNASTGVMSLLSHKWNTSTNAYTVSVCSVSFSSGSMTDYITYGQQDDYKNLLTTHRCILTKNGSDYYISVCYTYGSQDNLAANTAGTLRSLVTFSISSTNFASLTYHSSTSFPALAVVGLDSDNTSLLSIESSAMKQWSFGGSGFAEASSESGSFVAGTKDTDSRIFGVAYNDSDMASVADITIYDGGTAHKPFNISLHLISSSLANTATVEFEDATITYAGSNLSKNVLVNAYNTSSARVAKSVKLVITSGNAVFTSNSSTTSTVTTSTSADTSVGLTISGAGMITISASFTL